MLQYWHSVCVVGSPMMVFVDISGLAVKHFRLTQTLSGSGGVASCDSRVEGRNSNLVCLFTVMLAI